MKWRKKINTRREEVFRGLWGYGVRGVKGEWVEG